MPEDSQKQNVQAEQRGLLDDEAARTPEPPAAPETPAVRPAVAPVSRDTLRTRVYQALCRSLMKGHFEPGQAVTVRGLADAFGVSPTPVREALQRLTAEGALAAEPNRFYRVPVVTAALVDDLREVRAALEGLAAEKAARTISKGELKRLQSLDARMNKAIDQQDAKAYLSANEAFHFTIYEAAQSATLLLIIRSLWLQIGPTLNILFRSQRLLHSLTDNHRLAMKALGEGDGETARRAIQNDILTAGAFIAQQHAAGAETASVRKA